MIKDRLSEADCEGGFILDGYPRNLEQFKFLQTDIPVDFVIMIHLPDKIGIKRIAGRRVCKNGHTYHLAYAPPKQAGVCDEDNLPLTARADETEAAVAKRLMIYHQATEPLIAKCRVLPQVKYLEIDGQPSIDQVASEIQAKILSYDSI